MILFNRVGSAFKGIEGREWALLSLETLGVIAGILIAFELQEWAANRAASSRHAEVMDRLFEESEQDVASLREIRDALLQQSTREIEFATQLSAGNCPPESSWDAVGSVQMLPGFNLPQIRVSARPLQDFTLKWPGATVRSIISGVTGRTWFRPRTRASACVMIQRLTNPR